MPKKRTLALTGILALLGACTSVDVRPVAAQEPIRSVVGVSDLRPAGK